MPEPRIPDTDPAAQQALVEFLAAEKAKENILQPKDKFKKNEAQSGKIQVTAAELIKMAQDKGLRVVEGGSHMKVYSLDGKLLTEIHRHPGNLATGTARSILKALNRGTRG